jgi:hypothetical protein
LRGALSHLLVAYLRLQNMLGKADDHTMTDRLLDGRSENLGTWLRLVDREGDVYGLAGLDDSRWDSRSPTDLRPETKISVRLEGRPWLRLSFETSDCPINSE